MKDMVKTKALDQEIGRRLATQRILRGMSQSAVGDFIGVSFQQIQKYEKGINRISVGTLLLLCQKGGFSMDDVIGDLAGGPRASIWDLSAPAIRAARMIEKVPEERRLAAVGVLEKLVGAVQPVKETA